MIAVHRAQLYRRYYAPLLSGATVFFVLAHAATIVAAFLIAYYTHGFWVKESTYREQPIVSYAHTCSVKLQGINSKTQKAFELVYSTLPGINDMAEAAARVPVERVRDVDSNLDLIADTIKLDLVFPVDEAEGITHVQGMFIFAYELRNRVRLSMETPISIDYSAGVPGSALLIDGHMRLKAANPIQVRAAVRGTDLEPILDRKAQVSAPDVTFHALVGKAMMRNESIVLDPQLTAWQGRVHSEACQPKCTFTLSLTIHVPSDQVPYVPTFVEVAKFSWVQFITTVIFLRLFIKPLLNFISEHQMIQTIPRDPRKLEKLI